MASTIPVGEPYALAGKRIAFLDWTYVRPGSYGWFDSAGNNVTVGGAQERGEATLKLFDSPSGIRIVSIPGQRSGPILKAETPWEQNGDPILSTIIQDGAKYRGWGGVGGWGDLKSRGTKYFCYFESPDGMSWRRPDVGLVDFQGSKANNILDSEGGTVFIDPSAPPDQRFKWISESSFTNEQAEAYCQKRTCGIDFKSNRSDAGFIAGVRGAVSSDGLRWKIIDQPLALMHSDTQVVAYYDSVLKKYVGYFRDWAILPLAPGFEKSTQPNRWIDPGRRSIGRAETSEFREWPLSETLLEPPLWLKPSQVLYTNCHTTFPGTNHQLLFPAVWDQATDRTHLEIAASSDGKVWQWIPRQRAFFETAADGEWDGGCIFASPNLLELPGGDLALPYTGYNVPHKYPRQKAKRATGYAIWPKGRIAGIRAVSEGAFTTPAFLAPGNTVLINALCEDEGSIKIELSDLDGNKIAGRSFKECDPIAGDAHRKTVTWNSAEKSGIEKGMPIRIRFRLDRATLFSVDFA